MQRIVLASILLGALFAGCATQTQQNAAANGRPPRLQVAVHVPASMSVLRDDDISEAFAYRVASYLHEQGFRGRIHTVYPGEEPLPGVPTLDVQLMEWRVDRSGFVDCTFTAELVNDTQRRRLGIFHGTSIMTWPRRDWYMRAEGFEEAARDAITSLASKLEESGLIDRPAH